MFLRKLLVIVVPLAFCGVCAFFLPLLEDFGLWSKVLQGMILGGLLALMLPLAGATRRKEPFATLLVVPMIVVAVVAAVQVLTQQADGFSLMIECTFLAFMGVQAVRTKL